MVERSAAPDFADPEAFRVSTTSASLTSGKLGTLFHRVRAVQSCGTAGPASGTVPVHIIDGSPVVIFATQPPAIIRTLPDPPPTSAFEVQNIGGQTFTGYISVNGPPFVSVSESGLMVLAPGQRKMFTVELYGNLVDSPGTLQALLTIQSASGAQPKAYPWALVNATIAARQVSARGSFAADNDPPRFSTDFVSFRATPTNANPPVVEVSITNTRSTAMALAAETGPDGWVVPLSGWNATPLAPSETRTFTVESRRGQGETGGVLPRYAFLTVRTADGQSARVQFQDLDDTSGGPCTSRSALADGVSSLIVPSAVTSDRIADGRHVVFISRLLLSNVSVDPVVAELYFNPDPGAPADGFDCAPGRVLKATVQVPGSDVLSLTDPLSKLFGFSPSQQISGSLEVRSDRIGQLHAGSLVDSPSPLGGVYGFQLPVVKRGTGATNGIDHFVAGMISNDTYRTNLILTETSGKPATVLVTVTDQDGGILFRDTRSLPPYAKVQLNDGDLFKVKPVPVASGSIAVLSGDGTVVGLATVIDRSNQDASTLLSRPLNLPAATASRKRPLATGLPYRYVVPTVVNGYNSKPGRGPFPYESTLSITNGTATTRTYVLTYNPTGGDPKQTAQLAIGPRRSVSYTNVLREAFGITDSSTGSLLVDLDSPSVIMSSRVFSKTDDGNFGDAVPVVPSGTAASTSGADQRRLMADGFEFSTNVTRGARTNLVLTEIDGKPAHVQVRLFEKGKERSGAIGTATFRLAPFEKRQLNPVFAAAGDDGTTLDTGGKDRTNVLCEVVALPDSAGRIVSLGTRVDNVTADAKIFVMTPIGETQGVPTIGF